MRHFTSALTRRLICFFVSFMHTSPSLFSRFTQIPSAKNAAAASCVSSEAVDAHLEIFDKLAKRAGAMC